MLARRLALATFTGALLLAHAGDGRATRDRPPTAHSGGFGEPTCEACHLPDGGGAGGGRLAIDAPAAWEPGMTYRLRVSLVHAGMRAAGFQLTARFEGDGGQAGVLAVPATDSARADVTTDGGVHYAHHLYRGTEPATADSTCWTVVWTAPAEGGAVVFHAVANAADGDDSPIGDVVHVARGAAARSR